MKKTRKIKLIGAGGIGGHLAEPVARYLNCSDDNIEFTIFDGDDFEERNKERQRFSQCENKAFHTVEKLKEEFPKIHFRSKSEYITDDNVITSIRENDLVLLCVDNHATRKLVSDRCEELDNVTLVSGGNDYTDGNVILYIRKDGESLTKSPTELDPKIAKPDDKNPGDFTDEDRQGCQEESIENPQLLAANFAVASVMFNVLVGLDMEKANYNQVYLDVLQQRMRPSPDNFQKGA